MKYHPFRLRDPKLAARFLEIVDCKQLAFQLGSEYEARKTGGLTHAFKTKRIGRAIGIANVLVADKCATTSEEHLNNSRLFHKLIMKG